MWKWSTERFVPRKMEIFFVRFVEQTDASDDAK